MMANSERNMSDTVAAQVRKYDTPNSAEGSNEEDVSELFESPAIRKLMESDASTTVLLGRLKSSLLTCVEFTKYIRKKYMLEEGHALDMGKVYKSFFQGSGDSGLQAGIHKVLEYEGRLSQVKLSYVSALQKIHDELSTLLALITKSRKNLKENSRRLEKEVSDAIHSAEKAKARYFSFCQDREKLRLVDPTKTKLTLRGSKTTREQEEELQRKIDNADLEYKQKVDHATSLRNTYINKERPRIVSELHDLILELDTSMAIQLQKYTIWTENLILNSGVTVIPFEANGRSMKDFASSMDNKADLYNYLTRLGKNGLAVNKNLIPVDYRKHPSVVRQGKQGTVVEGSSQHSGTSFAVNPQNNSLPKRMLSTSMETPFNTGPSPLATPNGKSAMGLSPTSPAMASAGRQDGARSMLDVLDHSQQKSFSTLDPGQKTPGPQETSLVNSITTSLTTESSLGADQGRSAPHGTMRNTKTFGVPLDQLLEFEQDMVPAIVRQCLYVVDKYGLQLEGIYRRSANVLEVSKLREEIDKDPSNISMLLPSKNYTESDIYLVGSLLKAFFASLPDSLLPKSLSSEIRTCLSIVNPVTRKNFMHGLIYKLPDGQYWTLRALIFHLKRVLGNEERNRMNVKSLCIIWGPTIVPQNEDDETDVNFQISSMEVLFDVADQAFEPE